MHMYDILNRKRLGKADPDEIQFFVRGCTWGKFPIIRPPRCSWRFATGMDERETAELTLAMTHSGEMADLSGFPAEKPISTAPAALGTKPH